MKKHKGLSVSDGLAHRSVAAPEVAQGQVATGGDIVVVLLEHRAAMLTALAPLLLHEVIGEVGRKALSPVPLFVVDEDTVAPPVVEYLVGIGGVKNEGKAYDLRTEKSEGWHAVAGLPEILDESELPVGIGPEESGVHAYVLQRGVEIAPGQCVVGLPEEYHGLDSRGRPEVFREEPGDKVDLVLGLFGLPRHRRAPLVPSAVDPAPLADGLPERGKVHGEGEGEEVDIEPGVPSRRTGEENSIGTDLAVRSPLSPGVFLPDVFQGMVDDAFVGDGESPDAGGKGDLVPIPGRGDGCALRFRVWSKTLMQDEGNGDQILARHLLRQGNGIRSLQSVAGRRDDDLQIVAEVFSAGGKGEGKGGEQGQHKESALHRAGIPG